MGEGPVWFLAPSLLSERELLAAEEVGTEEVGVE